MCIARVAALVFALAATAGALPGFQIGGKALAEPILSPYALIGLVCFVSALSWAMFGLPKAQRLEKLVEEFIGTGLKYRRRRRLVELLVVTVTGGIVGFYLLTPKDGPTAITAGALWYGFFYRLAHKNS